MKYSARILLVFLVLLSLTSCGISGSKENKFSDEVNQYNYLDKEHDLRYIYDFESLLNEEEIAKLKNLIIDFKSATDVSIIIISNEKIGRQGNIVEAAKVLNEIFGEKYNLKKTVIIKISTPSKKVGMSSSEYIEHKLTDSICNRILKDYVTPEFKQNNYFKGINTGVEQIILEVNKIE